MFCDLSRAKGMDIIMKKKIQEFKIGNYVKVKKGVMNSEEEKYELEDWQGKIINIFIDEDDGPMVLIKWDSITLKNMPEMFIIESIEEDLEFSEMYLSIDEVICTECRDNDNEVDKTIMYINEKYHYVKPKLGNTGNVELDEQEKLIEEILEGVDEENWSEAEERWEEYLKNNLKFPFKVEVVDRCEHTQEISNGDILNVKKFLGTFDLYGIIVETRKGRYKYELPLCELEVSDKSSDNYIKVEAYNLWFCNR